MPSSRSQPFRLLPKRSSAQATFGGTSDVRCQRPHLKAAFAASHKAYGSSRLTTLMAARGLAMGRHRVSTLMRLNGLRPIWRRKFVHTTDSKHSMAVSANVLNRQFEQALPNVIWVCDITYIREIRLAVFGGSAGLAFAQDCLLGHGRCDARNTSMCGVAYGHRSKKSCN